MPQRGGRVPGQAGAAAPAAGAVSAQPAGQGALRKHEIGGELGSPTTLETPPHRFTPTNPLQGQTSQTDNVQAEYHHSHPPEAATVHNLLRQHAHMCVCVTPGPADLANAFC